RYEYSVPDVSRIRFLMMARLINAKGVREYYEAACLIKQKYPDITFRLIGRYDKGVDGISEDLYHKIQSGDVVQYQGWIDDVRPVIKESSVVILPSFYREGVPRSVQEGMACGRAIIATDGGGCRETVTPEEELRNGFLIPPKKSEALAEKREYYIHNPQEIIRHGQNGRIYAEEKFDVHKVNKDMLEILG